MSLLSVIWVNCDFYDLTQKRSTSAQWSSRCNWTCKRDSFSRRGREAKKHCPLTGGQLLRVRKSCYSCGYWLLGSLPFVLANYDCYCHPRNTHTQRHTHTHTGREEHECEKERKEGEGEGEGEGERRREGWNCNSCSWWLYWLTRFFKEHLLRVLSPLWQRKGGRAELVECVINIEIHNLY